MIRKSAIKVAEFKGFGGSYYDSVSHASMFRSYKPYNFGVKTSQLFSSSLRSDMINKKFTSLTIAAGNYHVLPGGTDDYEWEVVGDSKVRFRITELLVDINSQPGKDGESFFIAADHDWLHEPAIIITEDPNAPMLRIIGYPEPLSANSWKYEVELQTGDLNDWMPIDLLMPDRTFTRVSSAVSDELNQKYAPDQFGQMTKLRSWTGQFANKVEFTDKFLRTEIDCHNSGTAMNKNDNYKVGGKTYQDAIASGYVYQESLRGEDNRMINKGVFVTKAEARLLERTEMDREMMMEFGRLQKTEDRDTSRTIKIAPGWRQLVRDGHYWEHNGSLTLGDLFEYLNGIFFRRKNFDQRKIYIYSGEGGIEFLSRLIAEEASGLNLRDGDHFIRDNSTPMGYHKHEKEFGSQFTKIMGYNGVEISIYYDPIKDDDDLFTIKAPGTNRPLESYAMDIFDFGDTDYNIQGSNSNNITMVQQNGVEEYYTVSNVYDFQTGAIKDGSNAYSNNKEAGIYRTVSGSLCIWDVSRVGRIEYNPYM